MQKQTSNTIITLAYHSRCSSWKVSSKSCISSDFATLLCIKQGENENDAIRNRISDLTSDVFLNQKPKKQTSHEWQKTPDSSWISFCTSSGKRQLKHHKLTQNPVSLSCQSKQELTCQILTNKSINIGRRAWPTRDHGEKSQKKLSSLPVTTDWIFASEVSLQSKF